MNSKAWEKDRRWTRLLAKSCGRLMVKSNFNANDHVKKLHKIICKSACRYGYFDRTSVERGC